MLDVDGAKRNITVDPEPAVTGPKLVCDSATCGACTVLMDGKNLYSEQMVEIEVDDVGISPAQSSMKRVDGPLKVSGSGNYT